MIGVIGWSATPLVRGFQEEARSCPARKPEATSVVGKRPTGLPSACRKASPLTMCLRRTTADENAAELLARFTSGGYFRETLDAARKNACATRAKGLDATGVRC